jgi:hypothetical protein
MSDLALQRLQASLDAVPQQLDALRARAAKSTSAAEKAFCSEQIRQMEAYRQEMKKLHAGVAHHRLRHLARDQGPTSRSPHRVSRPCPHRGRRSDILSSEAGDLKRRHDSRRHALRRRRFPEDLAEDHRLSRRVRFRLPHARTRPAAAEPPAHDWYVQLHRGTRVEGLSGQGGRQNGSRSARKS